MEKECNAPIEKEVERVCHRISVEEFPVKPPVS